jgi:hypothetical protein
VGDSGADRTQPARDVIQRVVEAARHGQARLNAYRQDKGVLGTWLRSHLLRQGGKGQRTRLGRAIQSVLTARRLPQRQAVHRNGGGHRSTTATHALKRAAQAAGRKEDP